MSKANETVYLPPMRLVSFDEKVEVLTVELLNLSSESQSALKELIRLTWHIEQGIAKRRLMSDIPTGRQNSANPPGDTRMAGLLAEFNQSMRSLQARKRKQRERLVADLLKLADDYARRMAAIEGAHDPERIKERLAQKSEKPKSVTV